MGIRTGSKGIRASQKAGYGAPQIWPHQQYTDQERYAAKFPISNAAIAAKALASGASFGDLSPLQQQALRTAASKAPGVYGSLFEKIDPRIAEASRQAYARLQQTAALQATSEAIKQREQRAVAESQGIVVGTIGKSQISTSVGSVVSSAPQTKQPSSSMLAPQPVVTKQDEGLLYKVKLEDSVGVSGNISGQYGPTPKAMPKGSFVLGPVSGEPNLFSFGEPNYRNYNVYGPPTKPEKQDYPRSYAPKDVKPKDILKGFIEGGVKPLLIAAVAPKPIFSDIFGRPPEVEKKIQSVVKKEIKLIQPGYGKTTGKTFVGSTIEQLITGKPLAGTGEGLGYDIGSLSFDVTTAVAPVKSPIKIPAFKAVVEGGEVKTIAQSLQIIGKNVLTKTEGGFNIGGPLRNLEKSALAKIEGSVGKSTMEFGTQGKYTENILTSEKGMNILKEAGKALDRDLRFVPNQKRAAEIVKFAEKNIPDVARKQAKVFPKQPIKTIPPGIESDVLNVEIIGITKVPIKGTLAETMQLSESILKGTRPTPESPLKGLDPADVLKTPAKESGFSIRSLFPKAKPTTGIAKDVRDITTSDIDLSYAEIKYGIGRVAKTKIIDPKTGKIKTKLSYVDAGTVLAEKAAEKYANILQNVAGIGRKYIRKGTNVQVSEDGGKFETAINIVTKRDKKTGYLNEQKGKVFGQDLGRKILKFGIEGTKRKGKTISIESQALRRIESYVSLKGPLSEKFMGEGQPDYLKPGRELKKTKKGYGFSSDIYRLKDIVKNTRNFEQIAENLETYGFKNQAKELRSINEQTIKDFDELDFGLNIPEAVEQAVDIPSLASYVGSKIKSPVQVAGISATKIQSGRSSKDEYVLGNQRQSSVSKISKDLQDLVSKSIVQPKQKRQSYPSQPSQSSVIKTSLVNLAPESLSRIGSNVGKSKGRSGSSVSKSSLGISFGSVVGSKPSGSKPSQGSPMSYGIPDYYPTQYYDTPYYDVPGGGGKPPGSPTGSSLSLGKITKLPPPTTELRIKFPRFNLEFEERRRRKVPVYSKRNIFIAGPADIMRAGVFAAAKSRYGTIPELRSRSPDVFKQIDKLLGKARRRKGATRPLTF